MVDSQLLFISGMRLLLEREPDMEIVGHAKDGMEACQRVVELRPQLVIMDIALPGLGGAEVIERIKTRSPEVSVMVLSGLNDGAHVARSLRAGASKFISKRCDGAELLREIRSLAVGARGSPPNHPQLLEDGVSARRPPSTLSAREREVLRRLAAGHTAKEIAAQLGISARTLETYRARAMKKLALRNRADIVRYATQEGWL